MILEGNMVLENFNLSKLIFLIKNYYDKNLLITLIKTYFFDYSYKN
jgi:hypothetical protein